MTTVSPDGLTIIVTAIDKNDGYMSYTIYRCEKTELGFENKLRLDDEDRALCCDGLDEEEMREHIKSHNVPSSSIDLVLREARTYSFRGIHLSADVVDPSRPVIRNISWFLEYLSIVSEELIKSIIEQSIKDGGEDIFSQLAAAVDNLNKKAEKIRDANDAPVEASPSDTSN